jgi:hypothetical protein
MSLKIILNDLYQINDVINALCPVESDGWKSIKMTLCNDEEFCIIVDEFNFIRSDNGRGTYTWPWPSDTIRASDLINAAKKED